LDMGVPLVLDAFQPEDERGIAEPTYPLGFYVWRALSRKTSS